MLHHFNSRKEYWFCRQCWEEMPVIEPAESGTSILKEAAELIRRPVTIRLSPPLLAVALPTK